MRKLKFLLGIGLLTLGLMGRALYAEDHEISNEELDLIDQDDQAILDENKNPAVNEEDEISAMAEEDDLQSLKSDIGDFKDIDLFEKDLTIKDNKISLRPQRYDDSLEEAGASSGEGKGKGTGPGGKSARGMVNPSEELSPQIFNVGPEEKKLLELAKYVEGRLPEAEWDELAAKARVDHYTVQKGDWLWKISQKLFGSGFYYAKIWSLNPYIKNPHVIEPGMNLIFDTGNMDDLPQVKLGEFFAAGGKTGGSNDGRGIDFDAFGDETEPPWLKERQQLINQGVYFQYASEETYEDLERLSAYYSSREWDKYTPPMAEIIIQDPGDQYDRTGLDVNSKISFDFKEGFFLNTFVTSNVVQDFGEIDSIASEHHLIYSHETIFVRFDDYLKVKPGDKFSIYSAEGKVENAISERSGYRYTILGDFELIRQVGDLWEGRLINNTGLIKRKARITAYTPKINRIIQTFNPRKIEAAIIGTYEGLDNGLNYGSVVYLDRGRSDGVELGNVFEVAGFYDPGTGKKISSIPAYKSGEITVITLSDDFSTGLITNSNREITVGSIAITKSPAAAAQSSKSVRVKDFGFDNGAEGQELENLDVELDIDEVGEDLLKKADSIKLNEDELEELERQENEKSVLLDHERDLKELDRLEEEIEAAQAQAKDHQVDEDKYLEQQNLEKIEAESTDLDKNAYESLNEIESEVGRKYMDEDINASENPYGLTEFDLEEVDELMNTGPESK